MSARTNFTINCFLGVSYIRICVITNDDDDENGDDNDK